MKERFDNVANLHDLAVLREKRSRDVLTRSLHTDWIRSVVAFREGAR